jgi:Tol biopolymer transport system component
MSDHPDAWSPDGTSIIYTRGDGRRGHDLWSVASDGSAEPVEFIVSPQEETGVTVSPDGRWIAYVRQSTGRPEVWVREFQGEGHGEQVTVGGGFRPQWLDERTLLYWARPDGKDTLYRVRLDLDGDEIGVGGPVQVVEFVDRDLDGLDVHPDGRILVRLQPGSGAYNFATVLVGWQD